MFQIDLKSRKSIYEQVISNYKELILGGFIKSEEKLPSVRELAKDLTVNPNTVQKAYRELERQGYIYTVSGVGTFSTPVSEILPDEKMLEETKVKLRETLKELTYLGLDEADIKGIVDSILNEILAKGVKK